MKNLFTQIGEPLVVAAGRIIEKRHFIEPPVYIGGCGRSGTTLLLSVLSSHPEIFAFPRELNFFQDAEIRNSKVITPYRYRYYRELIRRKIKPTANRCCEKSPVNIHYFREIEAYHRGEFRMVHIIRDGRDVILSRHPRNSDAYWVEPERWIADVTKGLSYAGHPCMHTLKYEDLVENFSSTIASLCDFLNIPVAEEILNWHKHTTVRKNRALFSPIEEIKSSSIGKWKDERHAERAEILTSDPDGAALLSQLGYTSSS